MFNFDIELLKKIILFLYDIDITPIIDGLPNNSIEVIKRDNRYYDIDNNELIIINNKIGKKIFK